MKNQKGFTIIELIVVIAIIAILAAIVLINVSQYVAKAKVAGIKSDLKQLSTSAGAYFSSNGTYKGFCVSQDLENISNSITKIDASMTGFTCNDGLSYSGATGGGEWTSDSEGGVSACGDDQFYGWVDGAFNGTTAYCVDHTGTIREISTEYSPGSTCACQ